MLDQFHTISAKYKRSCFSKSTVQLPHLSSGSKTYVTGIWKCSSTLVQWHGVCNSTHSQVTVQIQLLLLVLEQKNISALLCCTSGVCLLLNLISLQQIFLWHRLGQCTLRCMMCLPLHVVHNVYCIYPQDRRSTHSICIRKAVHIQFLVSYPLRVSYKLKLDDKSP